MKKIDYTYSGILVKQNNKPDSISITRNKKGAALSHKFYKMFANSVVASPDPIVAYINLAINFTSEMIWWDFETKRIFSFQSHFFPSFNHKSVVCKIEKIYMHKKRLLYIVAKGHPTGSNLWSQSVGVWRNGIS